MSRLFSIAFKFTAFVSGFNWTAYQNTCQNVCIQDSLVCGSMNAGMMASDKVPQKKR